MQAAAWGTQTKHQRAPCWQKWKLHTHTHTYSQSHTQLCPNTLVYAKNAPGIEISSCLVDLCCPSLVAPAESSSACRYVTCLLVGHPCCVTF